MNMKRETAMAVFCGALLLTGGTAQAAHPLITDDAGTMGAGHYQVEVNGKYDHTDNEGVTEKRHELAAALTYGVTETVDLVAGLPYTSWSSKDNAAGKSSEHGIGDASLDLKWRFYEQDGLNLALKPGITLPTGDDDKALGGGKVAYRLFFITTKEMAPWVLHLNLGYIRNENTAADRENLWHVSAAAEVEVVKDLRLVANIGTERTADQTANTHPAFLLGGMIYSVNEHCDLDMGLKGGLNHAEPDYTVLAGITFKY